MPCWCRWHHSAHHFYEFLLHIEAFLIKKLCKFDRFVKEEEGWTGMQRSGSRQEPWLWV